MHFLCVLATALFALLPAGQALPLSLSPRDDQIKTLSTDEVAAFKPYSYYASAAYCEPNITHPWNCGNKCSENKDFVTTASGGDGVDVQYWYVGYDPNLHVVIVGREGTKPRDIMPLIRDVEIIRKELDSDLFPGISSSIGVHTGFATIQKKSAKDVLSAVNETMSKHDTEKVTVVGHSLGAAVALLDTVYLHLHLPSATLRYIGYGLPRIGNDAFARYVDEMGADITHINNKEDIIPILPGRFLGFAHPKGEVHIQDSGDWVACPGDDNKSKQCSRGDVSSIFKGHSSNHDGPYNGVRMGCRV